MHTCTIYSNHNPLYKKNFIAIENPISKVEMVVLVDDESGVVVVVDVVVGGVVTVGVGGVGVVVVSCGPLEL